MFATRKSKKSTPITALSTAVFSSWLKKQDKKTQSWIKSNGYTGAAGSFLCLPAADGATARVIFGTGGDDSLYTYAALPAQLPVNADGYYFDPPLPPARATAAALGWALGAYRFNAYKTAAPARDLSPLVWPAGADEDSIVTAAEAVYLVRDMVNTPASDLGPAEIARVAQQVARRFKGTKFSVITGEALLKKNYPCIYAVGKGSPRAPRLVDFSWNSTRKKLPLVTLVGKGVAFDTGGLDIKPSSAMALMKKDMGGAAHVLGLAHMIMSANLPVRLRVLIPAVENSVDGHSFRTSDILRTRKGITVEVGNTDAEGRLILADALAEACRDKPAVIIDFATLTGAARTALGPELPALFCNDDALADALLQSARAAEDPLWRLPLWQPYKDMLNSKVADTGNIGGGMAGAITAALFLEKFIDRGQPWVHIDTYAWNSGSRPGRPDGGEALGMRAVFDLIRKSYGRGK